MINKLLAKGSKDVVRTQKTVINEVSKISLLKPSAQMLAFSYAVIARSGKAFSLNESITGVSKSG